MPTLARFELEIHRRVEAGDGVTADYMTDLLADLFEEGYGGEMKMDRRHVGILWAKREHSAAAASPRWRSRAARLTDARRLPGSSARIRR